MTACVYSRSSVHVLWLLGWCFCGPSNSGSRGCLTLSSAMGSCSSCCIALSSLDNECFCLVLLYLYHVILCSVRFPGRPPQRRSEFGRQGRWKGDWRVGKQKLRCTESKSVFKNQTCHANSL